MPVLEASDFPGLLGSIPRGGGDWLKELLAQPESVERTRKLVTRLTQNGAHLPVSAVAPAAVIQAHEVFLAHLDQASAAADRLEVALQAVEDAARVDVDAGASALRKGAALVVSALQRPKARAAAELSQVTCLSAEAMALTALQELLDTVHANWSEWRESLADDAAVANDEAVKAFDVAAAAIATRAAALGRLNVLDHELGRRFGGDMAEAGMVIAYDGVGRVRLPGRPHPNQGDAAFGPDGVASVRAGLAERHEWALPLTGQVVEQEEDEAGERQPVPSYVVNR